MVARSLLRSARLLRSPAVAAARPARPMAGQAVRFASGLEITEEDEIKIPAKDFLMSTKPLWEIKPGADKEGRTEHVRSSDMPWILCSTLVFGPWIAYMLYTGDGHDAHKPNSSAAHSESTGLPRGQHGEQGDDHVFMNIGSGKEDGEEEDAEDGDNAEAGAEAEEQDGDDSGDKPTSEKVKDSVKTAVSAAAPKVAMDKEAKGESAPAPSGSSDADEGDYQPSQEEIAASLKRADRTAGARIAMDEEHRGHANQAWQDHERI